MYTGVYWCILAYNGVHLHMYTGAYIPEYTGIYWYIYNVVYWCILGYTCVYWRIPVYTLSKLVCTVALCILVLSNIMFNSFYILHLFVYTFNPVYTKVVQESRS